MPSLYIDIHTHRQHQDDAIFQLQNTIISRDTLTALPCSVGIHPWYIDSDYEKQFSALDHMLKQENVLAIGECGLDKLCETDWSLQKAAFQKQIHLAEKVKKPLIIHCVRAYQEVLRLLEETAQPVIFHGFNKKIDLAQQLIKKGYHVSLGSDILRGHLDQHIRELPLEKIFLETDDKPIAIIDIYTYFCTVRKISPLQLEEQMRTNFERVFKYVIK